MSDMVTLEQCGIEGKRYYFGREIIGALMCDRGQYLVVMQCPTCGGKTKLDCSLIATGVRSRKCRYCNRVETATTNSAASHRSRGRADYYSLGLPTKLRKKLVLIINGAIDRCRKRSSSGWFLYGGRGITVHEPWVHNRLLFAEYLLTLPGYDNPDNELDRVDTDKGYEPGNLRFATSKVNANNRRISCLLVVGGHKISCSTFLDCFLPDVTYRNGKKAFRECLEGAHPITAIRKYGGVVPQWLIEMIGEPQP